MALGKRKREEQGLWIATTELPKSPGHPFYQKLNELLAEEIVETVFGVPIALGTVANLEQEVSAALAPAHQEAIAAVRRADVKFADETSWKLWGKLCWLWAAATVNVAVFVIHAKRSALGLAVLLGEEINGILHSDRWHVCIASVESGKSLRSG